MNYSGTGITSAPPKGGGLRSHRQGHHDKKEDGSLTDQFVELVSSGQDERNWRGIGIALLVILIVCALIVTAVVLLTPGDEDSLVNNERLNLVEIFNGSFSPRRYNGSWLTEKEFIFRDSNGALVLFNAESINSSVLMSNITFRQYNVKKYLLSQDRKYVLLTYDITKMLKKDYNNIKIPSSCKLQPSCHWKRVFPLENDEELLYAGWGPVNNQLVFVKNNNIYYVPNVGADWIQITNDGKEGEIYNGIPDWVYEEEILFTNIAIWWSEDGKKLCFATFNDSNIHEMKYPFYGNFGDENNIYPKIINLRYPKPGTPNPEVTLRVVELSDSLVRPRDIMLPQEMKDVEHYFTQVTWIDSTRLAVVWLRRSQNYSVISICEEDKGWQCTKNIEETSRTGWVDIYERLIISEDKKSYFLRLPVNDGSNGKFRHIIKVDILNQQKTTLTHGSYDVTNILSHKEDMDTVYYITTLEDKPGERHVFSVKVMSAAAKQRSDMCLTCDLGDQCLYNSAIFSPGAKYYILECLGPGIPRTELRQVKENKLLLVLDNNDELRELYDQRAMPKIRTFKVPVSNGYSAIVRLFLPPELRDDEITKYPMLVYVYGGPGSQLVTEKFGVNWGTYLASQKSIIYAMIDGRGSGNRGENILHELYKNLGSVEIQDQINVARYLRNDLPFIDMEKIAIWGWSYGGYATAMALAADTGVFQCGMSVAPVTNWRYYDSVYTERYMKLPKENFIGYEKSNLLKKAGNIKGKKYLLIHGTSDDNVHILQSMMLMKALSEKGVLFQTQVYVDENHFLPHVKLHLYRTMEAFLDRCFNLSSTEEIGLQKTDKKGR
ncbi:prolyl endopeptidase FAP-like [Limulus polyphemus]|uniref:Prolyl endopeptidase FAP-like n=1 Tax=Limulus polyphemus TaxID=6850 RepID=A0ABM1S2J4_LIMPO|nr:prolyl endopeptidase FAP-like [Limulus polyphemus]